MKSRSTKTKILITIAIISLICWSTGLLFFVKDISNITPLIPDKQLDAIVVLTGGSNRIDEGFNLLEKKLGKKLFISGVYKSVDTNQLLKRWKDEPQSELDCCVVLGFEAINTVQNAIETTRWLKAQKFDKIYLVTSNYHMKRALFEFKKRDHDLEIIPFPIIPKNLDMNFWWKDPVHRTLIIKEYTKYTAIRFVNFLINW